MCDLSGQLAGAGATRYLAAFGAQVIRIEDPTNQGRWDIVRGSAPSVDERRGINLGGGFNNHNVEQARGDPQPADRRGQGALAALIAISDVVTENFAAGVFDRLGFAYECSASCGPTSSTSPTAASAHTGPYRTYKTWGPIVQACCGLTFIRAWPTSPGRLGLLLHGPHGGELHGPGRAGGLVHRNRTGEGQWVDMSCTEAGLALTGPEFWTTR